MTKMGYDLYLSDRVQELLQEGTLNEIIELVVQDLREDIFRTAPSDALQREQIYHEMHALTRIQLKMQTIVDSLRFEERR